MTMKLTKTLFGLMAGAALIGVSLLSGAKLIAQETNPQASAQAGQEQHKSQTFMGTVGKSKGALVLKTGYATSDPSAKTTYKLDDQDKAKPYVGKNVKVTGTLDASTNTIHVSDIEPTPAS
jgi:hypothetical protein